MRRNLGIGLIGSGEIIKGKFIPQITQLQSIGWDIRVSAVYSRTEQNAQRCATAVGGAQTYTNPDALLADDSVDAVIIATPHPQHGPLATAALNAGKHVLVEKPLVINKEQAQKLREAAKSRPGAIIMALPFVETPSFIRALDYVKEEFLGKVTGIEAELSFQGPPRSNWYYGDEAGGGAMLDTIVYPLARASALMGPAVSVTARVNTLIPRRLTLDGGKIASRVDDNVSIILEYPGGQHGHVHSIWARSFMQNGTVVHGRHGAVFIGRFGADLVIRTELKPPPEGQPIEFLGMTHCYSVPVAARKIEEDVVARFVSAIQSGKQPRSNLDIGLHIAEQQAAAYESARTGTTISLATTFQSWWQPEPALFDLSKDWL